MGTREVRAIAEAVADVLVERGLAVKHQDGPPGRVLSVNDVAALLGRSRTWVSAHAEELGAFRYSKGPRARLGFDAESIDRWKRERRLDEEGRRRHRRARRQTSLPLQSSTDLIPFE